MAQRPPTEVIETEYVQFSIDDPQRILKRDTVRSVMNFVFLALKKVHFDDDDELNKMQFTVKKTYSEDTGLVVLTSIEPRELRNTGSYCIGGNVISLNARQETAFWSSGKWWTISCEILQIFEKRVVSKTRVDSSRIFETELE